MEMISSGDNIGHLEDAKSMAGVLVRRFGDKTQTGKRTCKAK